MDGHHFFWSRVSGKKTVPILWTVIIFFEEGDNTNMAARNNKAPDHVNLAEAMANYLVTPYEKVDPKVCLIGSDIRKLKDDGFKMLANEINSKGYLSSSVISLKAHPTRPGHFLVIDGWHRLNAMLHLMSEGQLPEDTMIPAQIYNEKLPEGLMAAYADG